MSSQLAATEIFDVGRTLDQGQLKGYQLAVVVLAGFAVFLDGFDNQALSFALPMLMNEWHLPSARFAPLFAIGLIGVSCGTIICSVLCDRYGRRPVLIGSVLLFGSMSCAMATVNALDQLVVLRFLASLGMGGAMPAAASLVSEIVPARLRAVLVTLTVLSFPLGGTLGGVAASYLLPSLGWTALFVVGGVAAVMLGMVLIFVLPESPRYLVRHPHHRLRLIAILKRLGHLEHDVGKFIDSTEQPHLKTSIRVLLGRDLRRDTIALWMAFCCSLVAMQLVISWMPTLLASRGLTLEESSLGLSTYNLGGVLGAAAFGLITGRVGSRIAIAAALIGAITAAMLTGTSFFLGDNAQRLIAMLAILGLFSHSAQISLSTLAVHVYPTSVRAMGSGTTIAIGRIMAALVASFGGPWLIAMGAQSYFQMLGVAFLVTLIALMFITRHISAQPKVSALDEN